MDFGDGEGATGKTANHVYEYSGLFNITLSVSDGKVLNPPTTHIRIYVDRNETLWDNDGDTIPDELDDDDDNDGIPDAWEVAYPQYGLDPFNASDAKADFDGDGFTNIEEYEAGTALNDGKAFPGSGKTGSFSASVGVSPLVIVAIIVLVLVADLVALAIMVRQERKKEEQEARERELQEAVSAEQQAIDEIRKLYGAGPAAPGGGGPGAPPGGGWKAPPPPPAEGRPGTGPLPSAAYRPGLKTGQGGRRLPPPPPPR